MTKVGARAVTRSDWACFAGICLFALLLRLPIAAIPLERDEGEYAYIAQRWMHGDVPYRDAFNQKLPGAFIIYAFIERVIGTTPSAIHWERRSIRWARWRCSLSSAADSHRPPAGWRPAPLPL